MHVVPHCNEVASYWIFYARHKTIAVETPLLRLKSPLFLSTRRALFRLKLEF